MLTAGHADAEDGETALVAVFSRLAVEAGEAILAVRAAGCQTGWKADQSPVTEADSRAEAIILAGLAQACPDLPIVAEESVAAGNCPARIGARFILVDPLDGTREFIAGREDFTVNIALVVDGEPAVGIVYEPVRRQLFAGCGQGAWRRQVAQDRTLGPPETIRCRAAQGSPVIVASKSHLTPETSAFMARFKGAETVSIGSSLKFCLLAEGRADLYPRYGRTMEWDTAAGDAVLRAAGGATVTLDGRPLAYGKRAGAGGADFANPAFIAASGDGLAMARAALGL